MEKSKSVTRIKENFRCGFWKVHMKEKLRVNGRSETDGVGDLNLVDNGMKEVTIEWSE